MTPEVTAALGEALRLLRRRAYFEAELRERLAPLHAADAIDRALSKLVDWRFLDDERTLADYSDLFLQKNSGGPLKLAQMLTRHGLPESDAETIAHGVFSEVDSAELACQALQKRKPKNRHQAARFLISRGYEPDTVEEAVQMYFGSDENSWDETF